MRIAVVSPDSVVEFVLAARVTSETRQLELTFSSRAVQVCSGA